MNAIHYGVMRAPDGATLAKVPSNISSDGDSFLVWGERVDRTHHFYRPTSLDAANNDGIYETEDRALLRVLIADDRRRLEEALAPGARLIDYVVITDFDDWSEKVVVWTLEGALS